MYRYIKTIDRAQQDAYQYSNIHTHNYNYMYVHITAFLEYYYS